MLFFTGLCIIERKKYVRAVAALAERYMAQKTKKWEEWLSLSGETVKVVSYADYFAQRPLFSALQVKNTGEELVDDLTLAVTNENGMLIGVEKTLEEIPFESVVQVELGNVLSPLYFSNADEVGKNVSRRP